MNTFLLYNLAYYSNCKYKFKLINSKEDFLFLSLPLLRVKLGERK